MNLFDVLFAKKLAGGGSPFPPVIKRKTGNPIEITDAASAPLVKCVTEIQGSQDLHGYDKPWVGGAGKNKFNKATVQFNKAVDNTGTIISVNNYCVSEPISVNPNTNYYIQNGEGVFAFYTSAVFDSSNNFLRNCNISGGHGSSGVINTGEDAAYILINFYETNLDIGMFEIGSSPSAYEPYSNICPITAYTEGEIEVSDGDGNTTTHTTTFPSAIYRGSEDVVNGEVNYDMSIIDLGSLTWYLSNSGKWFYASVTGIKYESQGSQNINIICENYNTILPQSTSDMDNVDNGSVAQRISSNQIMIKDTSYNNPADFKMAMSGVKLAYELATPTTSSVTTTNLPIKSLSGYNHIESSTGEMTIDYITDAYQNFVDTTERALPNTRKGGVKAFEIFETLDNPGETPNEETTDTDEKALDESKEDKK